MQERFSFALHTFAPALDLQDTADARFCIKSHTLYIKHTSGETRIIDVARKINTECENQVLTDIDSFIIEDFENGQLTTSMPRVCFLSGVSSSSPTISIYNQSGGTLDVERLLELKTFLKDENLQSNSISTAELVSFMPNGVVVCVNRALLVPIVCKDDQYMPLKTIPLPEEKQTFRSFQIIGSICIIFDPGPEKLLSFISLFGEEVLTTLSLDSLQVDDSEVQTWKISTDFTKLAIILQSGDIMYRDVASLRPTNSSMMQRSVSQKVQHAGVNKYLSTCQFGDTPWKEKLLHLHSSCSTTNQQTLSEAKATGVDLIKRKQPTPRGPRVAKRVSGFHVKGKNSSMASLTPVMTPEIRVPDGLHGYSAEHLHVDSRHVTVVYTYNDTPVLCQWNVKSEHWSQYRFTPGEIIILSTNPSLPHMVITTTQLMCIVTDTRIGQEELVNELMTYGGASFADQVCHLNNWGRYTIPLQTLETGLKHRQLDTVSYFLKSKESIFMEHKTAVSDSAPSWASQCSHYESLVQLDPAISLLLQSVRDSMGDRQAVEFGRQVLDVMLDFLYGLLLEGLEVVETISEDEEREDVKLATDRLLQYIEGARSCVRQLDQSGHASRTSSLSAGSVQTSDSLSMFDTISTVSLDVAGSTLEGESDSGNQLKRWDQMDIETVLEDAIMNNQIPLVQQYLVQRGHSSRADYSMIRQEGQALAVDYIKHRNMKKAKELLTKLGLDIVDKLWDIALHTLDTALCTFITEDLLSLRVLSPKQVSMITFLQQLNKLYPCRDFENLINKYQHIKDREPHEVHRLRALTNLTPVYDLAEYCQNLGQGLNPTPDTKNEEPQPYIEMMLQWTEGMDDQTRAMVQLDVLLHKEGSDISHFENKVIWEYLLLHNMTEVLVAWIHNSYQGNKDTLRDDPEPKWPVTNLGPVRSEFVDHVELCTSVTRSQVLTAFARHGIFSQEMVTNFNLLLWQLNQVGGVLVKPHPLSQSLTMTVNHFHQDLIQYCIQHQLTSFLWIYCCIHSVSPEMILNLNQSDAGQTWRPLFNHFFTVATELNDVKSAMYKSSLRNAVSVWGSSSSNIGELLQQGHNLAALATVMYSPHQLQQVTFVTQQLEAFDGLSSETVERAIQMYPKLHVTLFPASVTDTPLADVTVYELLIGNAAFDPTKLFGWQTSNTCAGEDAATTMPYFSNANLVRGHGYQEHLRYTYYLKHGRASFAFVTFLAEELKSRNPTISSKRLTVAVGTALWMGIKHFNQRNIAASCAMFQELLGHDSQLLRTYVQVGEEVLQYRNSAITGVMEKRREQLRKNEEEIVELLLRCVQFSTIYAPKVLQALEAAILAGVTKDRLRLAGFESGQRWTLAVLFCQLMRLPYTTVFLESCAQANQWLSFIWFAQLHQYPKEQLLSILHHFKSPYLQEHLRYVLANTDIRWAREEQKRTETLRKSNLIAKDVRSNLYSRIGVKKDKDSDPSSSSSEDEGSAMMPLDTGDQEETEIQMTFESCPSDVFGVVFAAQSSASPWRSLLVYSITLRNPLFAELAASQQGASVLPCLCSWLVAMMEPTEHAQLLEHHGKSPWRYSMKVLDDILDVFVKKQWGSLLVTGFDIFEQNSPLLPFLQFYTVFTEKRDYKTCQVLLDEFKEAVFQFNHEKHVKQCIGDSDWLEKVTYKILRHLLDSNTSVYETTVLLKILETESITLVFKHEVPDFRKLSHMLQCVLEADLREVNLSCLLVPTSDSYQSESQAILDRLVDRQLYDGARKFAKLAGINADKVTITQMSRYKERLQSTDVWTDAAARSKVFRDCARAFVKHKTSAEAVTEFFQEALEVTDDLQEKARLYELCLYCTSQEASDTSELATTALYRSMWLCRIQHHLNITELKEAGHAVDDGATMAGEDRLLDQASVWAAKELMCFGKMPPSSQKSKDLSDKEVSALQTLLGELLDQGEITETCRLATEFSVYSQDLAIVLTCIRLSMGTVGMENLTPEMLHLLRTQPGSRHRQSIAAPVALLRNSSTISMMSMIQPMIDTVSGENEDKISAIERLLGHCERGKSTCIRVLTAFKIAAVLGVGYDDVVTGDDFTVLKSLLKTSCLARYRLAADFLGTSKLSPEEVACFLSDAIIQAYRVSLGEIAGNQELFFETEGNFSDFPQIVRLCREPSLLGNYLLQSVASMAGDAEQTSDKVLTLQTELLIRAHESYTAACDMEGISNILRAARILTSQLETASEFQLMTRLLTGVGRYNEMIYIFDSLQQHHQFELLLGKGMEKEGKLKTAILDYLKRYQPGDSDLYTMVALKFMMYREIAQQLQNNADKLINKLKGKTLDNKEETYQILQKITQYLSEAAESYIKDHCLRHAQACVRQARLIALQQKYLAASQQFIHLTDKGANLLIADHPVFSEAYIISEAYHKRDNWGVALCNNVIVKGNMKYLQEFRSHLRITPHLIEEAVDWYQQSNVEKTPQAQSNIKKLLQFCKDVRVQHTVAKQLGLRDVIFNMEKGDSKGFIMDFSTYTP